MIKKRQNNPTLIQQHVVFLSMYTEANIVIIKQMLKYHEMKCSNYIAKRLIDRCCVRSCFILLVNVARYEEKRLVF